MSLEETITELVHRVVILETRLSELEEWTRADEDRIYDRIKDIENKLETCMAEDNMKAGRKPHKCPVCDGKGSINTLENNIIRVIFCNACEGKRIVWG